LKIVQRALGHANAPTTAIYVEEDQGERSAATRRYGARFATGRV
jgi:hypothetical protein